VWSADGTIVTNAHVAVADRADVELADGGRSRGVVIARDPRRDLALLRVDAALPAAPSIGTPSALRPGEIVLAVGHPFGVANALALGVVHSVTNAAADASRRTPSVVRADIRLAPGNSGGPLADAAGRIVGVNAMIVGGLGVAISVDEVRRFVANQLPRPSLGATLRTVAVRRATEPSAIGGALLVLETTRGAAADGAGILPGDVILGHAGHPIHSPDDLLALLHDAGPGGTLRLDIGRGGRRMSVAVTLGPVVTATRRAA
jgi:serine protease Do